MICRLAGLAGAVALGPAAAAATTAYWSFDAAVPVAEGAWLRDAGPGEHTLLLAGGARLGDGRSGRALRADTSTAGQRVAVRTIRSPLHSRLNLGNEDWTLECWLWLDRAAEHEGVLVELGTGGARAPVTRWSVVPGENAFVVAALGRASAESAALSPAVDVPAADGPPGARLSWQRTALVAEGAAMPRERWQHVAIVHRAAAGEVRLFIDGRQRAVAAVALAALPATPGGYLSVAASGDGSRPLGGAIDELRVLDEAIYAADFVPPDPAAAAAERMRTARP